MHFTGAAKISLRLLLLKRVVSMEFNEKLQKLRKEKGLTQEELAEVLFVSRTAVSKWESGRGYPGIESLKAISKFFSVTIDDLLSGDEILTIAEDSAKEKEHRIRTLVFGLLDLSFALVLFLPFFGEKAGDIVRNVSLLSLTELSPILKFAFYVVITTGFLFGVLTLSLQNLKSTFWVQYGNKISLILNSVAVLLFIIGRTPYAAAFLFIFLIIKVLILTKKL